VRAKALTVAVSAFANVVGIVIRSLFADAKIVQFDEFSKLFVDYFCGLNNFLYLCPRKSSFLASAVDNDA